MDVNGRRARRMRSGADGPNEVVVEIERLVLDGFASLDRAAVGRAVEFALASHVATTEHVWTPGVDVDRLSASMQLGSIAPGHATTVGNQIAGVVNEAVVGAVAAASPQSRRNREDAASSR